LSCTKIFPYSNRQEVIFLLLSVLVCQIWSIELLIYLICLLVFLTSFFRTWRGLCHILQKWNSGNFWSRMDWL